VEPVHGRGSRLEQSAAELAIAFGHAARRAYRQVRDWGEDLEVELEHDWKRAGNESEYAWKKVRKAVKHGWDSANDG
jgi:hypothetical protein